MIKGESTPLKCWFAMGEPGSPGVSLTRIVGLCVPSLPSWQARGPSVLQADCWNWSRMNSCANNMIIDFSGIDFMRPHIYTWEGGGWQKRKSLCARTGLLSTPVIGTASIWL